jgi:hypothetical protein
MSAADRKYDVENIRTNIKRIDATKTTSNLNNELKHSWQI